MPPERPPARFERPSEGAILARSLGLVDAVDHLLNRGAVVVGEATLSLAGVDLVYLGLQLMISSVETLQAAGGGPSPPGPPSLKGRGGSGGPGEMTPDVTMQEGSGRIPPGPPLPKGKGPGVRPAPPLPPGRPESYTPGQRDLAPPGVPSVGRAAASSAALPAGLPGGEASAGERPEQGLARLVLALVELLRQLLERQAVRRMEGGRLEEDQVERMGQALLELEEKMAELRRVFGLSEEDINVDLGPLGQLL